MKVRNIPDNQVGVIPDSAEDHSQVGFAPELDVIDHPASQVKCSATLFISSQYRSVLRRLRYFLNTQVASLERESKGASQADSYSRKYLTTS